MGVEFSNCPACDEVYCDAEPTYHCKKCGHTICERCESKYSEIHQDDPDICPFCAGDIMTDSMKLQEIKKLVDVYLPKPDYVKLSLLYGIRKILEK